MIVGTAQFGLHPADEVECGYGATRVGGYQQPPPGVAVSHLLPSSSEVPPIALTELAPDEHGVCHESEEEGEILVVALRTLGAAFVLSGAALDEDAAGKVGAWDGPGAFPYLNLGSPASLECVRAALDADGCRLPDSSQVGSAAGALWCEHVDADVSSMEAVGDPVGTDAGGFEIDSAERRDVLLEGSESESDVYDGVEVFRNAGWCGAVLQAEEEHHLASDQGPGAVLCAAADVDKGFPHRSEQVRSSWG
ncbi:MAG: hypothetical protein ABIJ48_00900 [Actinomycetota bacterium]